MSKTEKNKALKRSVIIAAAKRVFLSEGYTKANMDKVSELAKVSKQTIYQYFPSKSELLKETLLQARKDLDVDFINHLDDGKTSTALYNFAVAFIKANLSKDFLDILRILIARDAELSGIHEAFLSTELGHVGKRLTNFFGQHLGIENADIIAKLWITMLLSHREEALMNINHPTDTQIKDHAKIATNFLVRAFQNRKSDVDLVQPEERE